MREKLPESLHEIAITDSSIHRLIEEYINFTGENGVMSLSEFYTRIIKHLSDEKKIMMTEYLDLKKASRVAPEGYYCKESFEAGRQSILNSQESKKT